MGPLLVHLFFQGILLFEALGWDVKMPKDIHGLKGSCLVIPCSFSYTLYPPENPRRVVWYQWVSRGYPLVYDSWSPNNVIDKFRGKTRLYTKSLWDCSLVISKVDHAHHGEKIYAWIDPENVGWRTYAFYDTTATIFVDENPERPKIDIYGGDRMSETMRVVCSAFHTCPYSKPTITLDGVAGSGQTQHEKMKNGQWKMILTRTAVMMVESLTIECSVTHYGGIKVSATKQKNAKCVHQKITIEPEMADVTEGVKQTLKCSVYHSCQKESPTIIWNYKDMPVSTTSTKHSGLNKVTSSIITFQGTTDDNGKKLICTAKFSGGDAQASAIIHVQRVLLINAVGWEIKIPQDIHGLRGSCLVIPCSSSFKSQAPNNPYRVVWYQWVSNGNTVVYDSAKPYQAIEKFKGKTDLFDRSGCSLLIKKMEQSHHGEILYTRIDPENKVWSTYKHHDVTSKILIDASPQEPEIIIYGGEKMYDSITVICWTFHTCPYSKPKITLNGIEGSDIIKDDEHFKDGQWKITLTRKAVVQTDNLKIECLVTHYGDIKAKATKDISAKCVQRNITIEPEVADVTEGVEQKFTCSVYHSCKTENPVITWNYERMQVSHGIRTLSGPDRVTFSTISFLAAKEDNEKKLMCSAKISGGNIESFVVLRVHEYQKPDPVLNETYFQYVADVIPKITALPHSCVVIPCSFKLDNEFVTRLRVLWVTKKGDYMFHTHLMDVSDNFKRRTRLLGDPDEQNCTVEINDVQTHDNGPFCFQAERENEKYSFNNSCVFIIMRKSPDKPVMSTLPEDIEPGTRVTVKCSVNHTCSSHPPEITWSVPPVQEIISHNPMGGGVWETVSTVSFIPTGYEVQDEIVCSANFWGGKTQRNSSSIMSIKRVQGIKSETLYAIAASLIFIVICVFAGVFIYKRQQRRPHHDGQESQYEQRRSTWSRFSSRFSLAVGRAAWTNRGNRNDIRFAGNAPERPPKPEQRRSIWSRFSRHQSPRTEMRVEYKANNTHAVYENKNFSKPHMPSPRSNPKSYNVFY